MGSNKQRTTFFAKFISSYVLICLVIIVIVIAFVYAYVFTEVRTGLENNHKSLLQLITQQFDLRTQEMNRIALDIFLNDELNPTSLNTSAFNTQRGIARLNSYQLVSEHISDVMIHTADRVIYTSRGVYRNYRASLILDNRFNTELAEEIFSLFDFAHNHRSPMFTIFIYTDRLGFENRAYMYIVPDIFSRNVENRRDVAFMLNSTFLSMFRISEMDVYLFDLSLNTLYSLAGDSCDVDYLTYFLSESDYHVSEIPINDGRFFMLSYTVNGSHSIIVASDYNTVFGPLIILRNTLFIVIFLILLAILIIAFFSAKSYYVPVSRLAKSLLQMNPDTSVQNIQTLIDFTLITLRKKDDDYTDLLSQSKPAQKDYLLLNTFGGQIFTKDDFNKAGQEFGIHIDNENFIIAQFFFHEKTLARQEILTIIDSIEKDAPKGIVCYGKHNADGTFTFLFSFLSENDEIVLNYIDEIVKHEWVQDGILYAGLSETLTEFSNLGMGYVQAVSSQENFVAYDNSRTVRFSALTKILTGDIRYPYDLIKTLDGYLRDGNSSEIEKQTTRLIQYITDNKMPIFLVRCLCYDILNTIIRRQYALTPYDNDNTLQELNLTRLLEFKTLDELKTVVLSISAHFCSIVQKNKELAVSGLIKQIEEFISQNYLSSSFSVGMVAEHFKMSQSGLSHYYKKHTQINISEYINNLRMDKAKTLLCDTDIPVNEIVQMIGYFDVSSFTRKFRQYTGYSPGMYRKEQRYIT